MSESLLLDTNAAIAFMEGDSGVLQRLTGSYVTISSIVLGELCYGARKSGRVSVNLARVDAFAAKCTVLSCDVETAQYYGEIKQVLEAKGRPMPDNDMWIAATAVQYTLPVLSRDKHFKIMSKLVEGLWVEVW